MSESKEKIGERALSDKIIMGVREREAVHRAAAALDEKTRHVFMFYGGNHDFTHAVKVWNTLNTDRKISLITITPQGYNE